MPSGMGKCWRYTKSALCLLDFKCKARAMNNEDFKERPLLLRWLKKVTEHTKGWAFPETPDPECRMPPKRQHGFIGLLGSLLCTYSSGLEFSFTLCWHE